MLYLVHYNDVCQLTGDVELKNYLLQPMCLYSERLANFSVTISDQRWPVTQDQMDGPKFTKCGQYLGIPPAAATVTVNCTPPGVLGRYVYISTTHKDWMLIICEAEVAGSEFGPVVWLWFGCLLAVPENGNCCNCPCQYHSIFCVDPQNHL